MNDLLTKTPYTHTIELGKHHKHYLCYQLEPFKPLVIKKNDDLQFEMKASFNPSCYGEGRFTPPPPFVFCP